MSEDSKNRALLTGTIIYAIGTFGTKILSFLIVPLYTYYIIPSDLGDYDLLLTTVSLLSPILTLKISEATYRWIIKKQENEIPCISATYKILFRNCLFFACVLLAINYFIPIWNCYYFILILIGDRVLECLQKLLRGLKNQKLFAISGFFHTAVMLGLNLVKICYLNEGVIALLQSNAISLYLTIILILICEKRLRTIDLKHNTKTVEHEMMKYSMPLVPSALNWWLMSASDRYVIRWVVGSTANGIYAIACKFPSVLQTVFSLFNNAWTDMALSEFEKGDKSEQYTKELFRKLYKVSFCMVFVLIPVTKLVMKLVLDISYSDSAMYVGFLYLGTVFQGFSTFCNIGYLQGKKTGGAARTSLIGAFVNLIIDLLFIKFIGIFAASISTFMGFFTMWIIRMKDIKTTFPIKVDSLEFSAYLIVGIVMATVTIFTDNKLDLILAVLSSAVFVIFNKDLIIKTWTAITKKIMA